jgi:hypothetical protein
VFVGHYAAAFAAKTIAPKAPLWTLAAAAQLVDIGWSAFIMAGIEHASVDPSLPGSSFVLYDMPWTHSLPGALAWSLGAALLARLLLRTSWNVSALIGAVVFSHWLLDLLVHRPDLALWPGGQAVGLGLWNYPVPEEIVEMGLLAITGALWAASRARHHQATWSTGLFLTLLVALQLVAVLMPGEAGPLGFDNALLILAVYLIVIGGAWLTDRGQRRT